MMALSSVWIALASFFVALAMVLHRPLFTDVTVTLVLYFGSPGAMCFAGLVLWAHRKEPATDAGIRAQRVQAKVAIALAILSALIVYILIFRSQEFEPIVPPVTTSYNDSDSTERSPGSVTVSADVLVGEWPRRLSGVAVIDCRPNRLQPQGGYYHGVPTGRRLRRFRHGPRSPSIRRGSRPCTLLSTANMKRLTTA